MEEAIEENPEKFTNITNSNNVTYATALTIQNILIPDSKLGKFIKRNPPWKKLIQKKINELKEDVSHIRECQNTSLSYTMKPKDSILHYSIENLRDYTKISEKLKHK
ncbi:hypothetical protein HHI36_008661 [Cryptolaemus montrouzieri]|uniref:Uncharacterized protein n=1 Tax=Cryptolaemus montrouzieri TaxID=559131 RepID=A0ABD2MTF3_9CUCU